MLKTNETAILYAEIDCGTDLKNSLGGWMNGQRINQMISMMSESINTHSGIVSKTFDKGILATFIKTDSAYKAADKILSNQIALVLDENASATIPLNVKIILNYGKMLVVAGNISGDQLVESVQLAPKAKPGTILYTSSFSEKFNSKTKIKPKNIGKLKLENMGSEVQAFQIDYGILGKQSDSKNFVNKEEPKQSSEPSKNKQEVIRQSSQEGVKTVIASEVDTPSIHATLHIQVNNKSFVLDETSSVVTLGRAPDNTITIPLPYVSRKHSIIEYKEGSFVITNVGANRTYIKKMDNDMETICRDRESEILQNKGEISLGCPIKKQDEYLITFDIKMK